MSLPWSSVNESPPAAIAEILELPKSPHGGRKLCCPFCGGRNFAPLDRAFFCYSGCGGKSFSNVDTAARVWGVGSAEACTRLAAILGLQTSGNEVPWKEVSTYVTAEVAAALTLTAGKDRWLWDCPSCGGSSTLRSYRRRWRCQSISCSRDERQGWRTHVALAVAVWRTSPVDACHRLAAELRSRSLPVAIPSLELRARPEGPSPRELALAAIQNRPGATPPHRLYELLLSHLRLGAAGRAELTSRGLDIARAERYGFRSVELGEWRARVLPFMAAFHDDELVAAGFPRERSRQTQHSAYTPWWPGFGRAPLLVIPVLDGARVAGIRFRNLGDPATTRCPRYASPKDVNPDAPFNARALASGARTLHIVEGEVNGYVLTVPPYQQQAVGLLGAWTWQDSWAERIQDATHYVVGWFDNDPAGRKGAAKVRIGLANARGHEWARQRWRAMLVDRDTSEQHVSGDLAIIVRASPWVAQDPGVLWPADGDPDLGEADRVPNRR
jgi:hypothetical protein